MGKPIRTVSISRAYVERLKSDWRHYARRSVFDSAERALNNSQSQQISNPVITSSVRRYVVNIVRSVKKKIGDFYKISYTISSLDFFMLCLDTYTNTMQLLHISADLLCTSVRSYPNIRRPLGLKLA